MPLVFIFKAFAKTGGKRRLFAGDVKVVMVLRHFPSFLLKNLLLRLL